MTASDPKCDIGIKLSGALRHLSTTGIGQPAAGCYHIAAMRLLKLLLMCMMVVVHGTSVASAICHHGSAQEHIAARQSLDPLSAASALNEEAAADVSDQKGSQSSAAAGLVPVVDLPQEIRFHVPPKAERGGVVRPPDTRALSNRSVDPLLRPPAV